MLDLERSVEWYVALTCAVLGISHVLRAADWRDTFQRMLAGGRPMAFLNGALSLFTGAAIVATHRTLAWPKVVLVAFGWLNVLKGLVCLVTPDGGLRSMQRASVPGFVVAGVGLLAISAWAAFCAFAG